MNKQSLALVIASISVAIIAIIVAIVCLISAKSNKNTTEQSSSVKTATVQQTGAVQQTEAVQQTTVDTTTEPVVTTTKTADEKVNDFKIPDIKPCVLSDSFGIKTEFTGLSYDFFSGLKLNIKITNNSVRGIYVRSNGILVNDLTYDSDYSVDNIEIGQSGNLEIKIDSLWLAEIGLDKVSEFTLNFRIYNTDDYKPIDNYDNIKLKVEGAPAFESSDKYNDENSIKISEINGVEFRLVESGYSRYQGNYVTVFVKNPTDEYYRIYVEDFSVNQERQGASTSRSVMANSMAKFALYTGVESIDDVDSMIVYFKLIPDSGGEPLQTPVAVINKDQLDILK